jgi:peroxiredoxin
VTEDRLAAFMAVVLGGLTACSAPPRPAKTAAHQSHAARVSSPADLYLSRGQVDALERTKAIIGELCSLRFVGMDDGQVPDFSLRAADGQVFDSQALVGKRPFVVVFFATWCPTCEQKMPLVEQALHKLGRVTVIGVSVDDDDTWPRVEQYLERHGLSFPVVRAESYPRFSVSYDPFSTVPLVIVVGRNGGLVDYQMGYQPDDAKRLVKAVKLARVIGPLAHPNDGKDPNCTKP